MNYWIAPKPSTGSFRVWLDCVLRHPPADRFWMAFERPGSSLILFATPSSVESCFETVIA